MEDATLATLRKFYEKYLNHTHWTLKAVDEWVFKVVNSMWLTFHLVLRKQLPVADPKHNPLFLEQVKSHYGTHNESHEMTQW